MSTQPVDDMYGALEIENWIRGGVRTDEIVLLKALVYTHDAIARVVVPENSLGNALVVLICHNPLHVGGNNDRSCSVCSWRNVCQPVVDAVDNVDVVIDFESAD